ncbi:MAG: amidohydrolase family protein, partial [Synergistaceae bacterium]|nr:amidohydrolase family protein [Synergistaceae bacterium]
MSILFKNANVFTQHGIKRQSVLLHDGKLRTNAKIFPHEAEQVIELEGLFMFPGFVDVHVHLREPGFSYKETIRTGTSAAAHG